MIARFVRNNDIDCVFVNNELTPVQIKNLKKLFEAKANDKPSPRSITS
jgi:50S ribosomal subunit-associated GTPase HflX